MNDSQQSLSTEPKGQLEGKRALLVDDDVHFLRFLRHLLEKNGVTCLEACHGLKGLEVLEAEKVDFILSDIDMPEMDGYETMREIRQMAQFRTLPILALTAKAMKGDREACMKAGASDYISKPIDQERLLSLLRVSGCRAEPATVGCFAIYSSDRETGVQRAFVWATARSGQLFAQAL